jgi:nucleoside diphosphate kinase
MGIVEGEGAIAKLLEVVGESTDPRQCAPHTIRARFGTEPLNWQGHFVYFQNVMHRSKTPDEVKRDIELFKALTTPAS